MNKKPVLVVMAAGMGSRYGGLKQIDPIGPEGEIIIDYSLYDAHRAGFDTAICIIKHQIEADFKAVMERGAAKKMNILYAYQDIEAIPEGFAVPEGRVKPWGTAHAMYAAKDLIDGAPFAIINADDYYGPGAFKLLYDYLSKVEETEPYDFCMAGYRVENTLTENGSVARGVCVMKDGYITRIDERTNICRRDGNVVFSEDDGKTWTKVEPGTVVSMNCFGFTPAILKETGDRMAENIKRILETNPLKGEYYIPVLTSELINEGKATLKVLPTDDRWFGVTYKEDRQTVVDAMKKKTEDGLYPKGLWK